MSDETLFAAALEQPDPAARAAYLDAACPDPETRRRLDSLLTAHDKAGDFLDRPAIERPAPETAPTRAFAPEAEHTRTHGGTVDTDTDEALGFLAPAERPDSLGRIGHYEVLEVLGRGGFGIVFRAFDEVLQRVVAVKVLAPSMAATSPARKRFLREARSSAKVRHENVVQIHDTSRDEDRLPYLVMEFIPGETLQERLDRTGPLNVPEILRIGRQVASGLAAAHEMDLVHRDIKPSNILIDTGPQERVKITDFGLARAADDASISQSGIVAGTPMYMAPEQAKGDSLDHRADLFSLGSVLYVMCTGRPPFRAESTLAVLKRVAEDDPRPIREIIPEVPEWLCRIIAKLHAKDPAERYQSAKDVADVLADCEKQIRTNAALTDYSLIPGGKPEPFQPVPGTGSILALILGPILIGFALLALDDYWPAGLIVGGALAAIIPLILIHRRNKFRSGAKSVASGSAAQPAPSPWTDPSPAWSYVVFMFFALIGAGFFANMIGRSLAPQDFDGWNHSWEGTLVFCAFGLVLIALTIWRTRRQLASAARTAGARVPTTVSTPRIARWRWVAAPLAILLLIGTLLFGRSVMLYLNNQGELEIKPQEGLVSVIVLQNNEGVLDGDKLHASMTDWLDMKQGHTLKLPPGRYQLNVGTWPAGTRVTEWEVTTSGPFGSNRLTVPVVRTSAIVTVVRGHRVTVRPKVSTITAPPPSPTPDSDGFVPLFNGKDISGWTSHPRQPGNWHVEDGILVGGAGTVSHLFTERGDYENFHLRAEVKINFRGKKGAYFGNSGIFFRTPFTIDKGDPPLYPTGYEAQIFAGDRTPVYEGREKNRTGSLYGLKPYEGLIEGADAGEWFTLEIIAVGKRITIRVNGTTTVNGFEDSSFQRGHIALQQTGAETFVQFRKIEIKQLPASTPKEQWTSLFNGKDLAGWKTHPDQPGNWSVVDGVLVGRGPSVSHLFSERGDYADFELRVEARISHPGDSGIFFRSDFGPNRSVPRWNTAVPDAYEAQICYTDIPAWKTGTLIGSEAQALHPIDTNVIRPLEWFQMEIAARDNRIRIRVNGQELVDSIDDSRKYDRGHISLQVFDPKTKVEFRKIEIKELRASPPSGSQPIAGWGTPIDPKGDCKFELATDGLSITVPGGKHNLNPTPEFNNLDAPRVLRSAMGDFQFDSRVESFSTPQGRLAGIKDNYVAAGVLLWQDEKNFLRFLRAGNGATRNVFIHLEYFRDGRMAAGTSLNIPSQPALLRVSRAGTALRFQWSLDGKLWREYPVRTPITLTDKLDVGVCVLNTTELPFSAKFSQSQFRAGAESFTPLFNCKDLTGWSGKFTEAWSVENGLLTGRGKNGSADEWSELIHSRDKLQDFHLRAEARINGTGWASIRVRKQKDSPKGYKIWLSNNPEKTGARTGRLDVDGGPDNLIITNPPEDLRVPADEWFTLDLLARGPELVLSINGKEAARLNDAAFPRGEIQLEVAGADTVVQFRKFEIQELSSANAGIAPSPAVAPFDAAKAREHQEAWAKHLGVPVEYTNSIGMKLRLIPPGEFMMGTHPDLVETLLSLAKRERALPHEITRLEREGVQRPVRLTTPFYLGTFEVTHDQFRQFVKATGYKTELETTGTGGYSNFRRKWVRRPEHVWSTPGEWSPEPNEPVVLITARDAEAFCAWLSEKEGGRYVLPTEAQWEYACRAGTTGLTYAAPGRPLSEIAWTRENIAPEAHRPQVVGKKRSNAFGLHDMLGNVWEYTADWYSLGVVKPDALTDPGGPANGQFHTIRGGAWYRSGALFAHCASRSAGFEQSLSDAGLGFRVAIVGKLKPYSTAQRPDPAVLAPLRDLVDASGRNRDLVKARFEAGTSSRIDLLKAEADVVEARIRLAEAEGSNTDVVALHEVLVAHRKEERDLIAIRVDAGADAPDALGKADSRLADARVRLAKIKPPAAAAPAPRPKP